MPFAAASMCSYLDLASVISTVQATGLPLHLQAGGEPAATTLQGLQQHNPGLLTAHLTTRQMVRQGVDRRLTPSWPWLCTESSGRLVTLLARVMVQNLHCVSESMFQVPRALAS